MQTLIILYCFVGLMMFGFINDPLKHKFKVDFFTSILWPLTLPIFVGNYLRVIIKRITSFVFIKTKH